MAGSRRLYRQVEDPIGNRWLAEKWGGRHPSTPICVSLPTLNAVFAHFGVHTNFGSAPKWKLKGYIFHVHDWIEWKKFPIFAELNKNVKSFDFPLKFGRILLINPKLFMKSQINLEISEAHSVGRLSQFWDLSSCHVKWQKIGLFSGRLKQVYRLRLHMFVNQFSRNFVDSLKNGDTLLAKNV